MSATKEQLIAELRNALTPLFILPDEIESYECLPWRSEHHEDFREALSDAKQCRGRIERLLIQILRAE
jgi:TorA maturation chaperone TorD